MAKICCAAAERGNGRPGRSVLPVRTMRSAMTNKPKSERDPVRPSEDDLAQARLGGPRGAPELAPAKMTPQREKKTPGGFDPGAPAGDGARGSRHRLGGKP